MKELRELLLQMKTIDWSKRPVVLKLPQGENYTLALLSLPFFLYLGYEFFKDWNEGRLAYEYLALSAMSLSWGLTQFKQFLSRYEITIDEDELSFSRKHFFRTAESWKTSLKQYQALELVYIAGDKPAETLFSVDLIHPDPSKCLPLATSQQEALARGRLEQWKMALSLPVVDKVAARSQFSRTEKKAIRSFWRSPGGVMLLLVGGLPVGLLGWYFWTLHTSPMDTVSCTVTAHEVTESQDPQPNGKDKLLTTYYRYEYQGQVYESGKKIGHYKNEENMQRWKSKRPKGTQAYCLVDSRDPARIFEFPLPKSYWDGILYATAGLAILGTLFVVWTFFPLGFKGGPKTTFEHITKRNEKDKIKKRYRASILELKNLGFQGYCFYTEISSTFSLATGFLTFLMMLGKKEVLSIRFPLRIATSYPLLTMPDTHTYAVVYALETRFQTLFTDGTMLITGTEGRIPNYADTDEKIYRQGATQSIALAWEQHQKRVEVFKQEGKQEQRDTRFQDYAEMLSRNEKVLLDNHLFQGA